MALKKQFLGAFFIKKGSLLAEQVNQEIESRQNVKMVWLSYFKWFVVVVVLAVLASILAECVNVYFSFTALTIKIIQISSLVIESTALGVRGHTILTWGGESPAEKLDGRLFMVFSALGFFLIIFSFQLQAKLT